MGFYLQQYLAILGRSINPGTWRKQWKALHGRSFNSVGTQIAESLNRQIALGAHVSSYRFWWWANPLGMGLLFYFAYKTWHMTYMVAKQKKTAQLVAAAYGQGGQWLNPVPK